MFFSLTLTLTLTRTFRRVFVDMGVRDANAEHDHDPGDAERRCPKFDTEVIRVLVRLRV